MKLAKFYDIKIDLTMIYDEVHGQYTSLQRVSEWVDVDFPERPREEVIPEQIELLNKQIQDINAKAGKLVADINARKTELLALTQEVVA